MKSVRKSLERYFMQRVFDRDEHRCKICSEGSTNLVAHAITPHTKMPKGGYVPENGITLCEDCHLALVQGNVEGVKPQFRREYRAIYEKTTAKNIQELFYNSLNTTKEQAEAVALWDSPVEATRLAS